MFSHAMTRVCDEAANCMRLGSFKKNMWFLAADSQRWTQVTVGVGKVGAAGTQSTVTMKFNETQMVGVSLFTLSSTLKSCEADCPCAVDV
jgi:hypothetical protein